MRFEIEKAVLEEAPDIVIGVVVAEGIDNSRAREGIRALLDECIAASLSGLAARAKEDARIVAYRDAFSRFGINPNKYPCSIEAIMTRLQKGGQLPSINAVVDLGNAVSIKYILPIGAHDLAQIVGELSLRKARPGDRFLPFGSAEEEAPEEGEIVYASGDRVRTRRWMWRQSETGKIGEESSHVFFPIDGFASFNEEAVIKARDELARLIESELGGRTVTGLVRRGAPVFEA
jgi:DNA/RNA-binding domain of Phe-tRNA-synthetase-like protein